MNSVMTINVRVVGRQAVAQLNQVTAAVAKVNAAGSRGGAGIFAQFENAMNSKLVRSMQRLNAMARQMTYTLTLPFVLLARQSIQTAFAIETSMNRVVKVYGDLSFSAGRVKEETDALAKSFELLSTRFGVHQEEVIDIAAAWASAGSAGRGLAENTKLTLEAMILGELEATQATEGLIAIQAQWGYSTVKNAAGVSEMSNALAQLNIVENQTGVTMEGLIDSLQRSSGVARVSGMTFEELAAMTAALVPAAGSAAQAGNALKTIIASMQAPTQEVIDTLQLMGIEVNSPEWLGKTVTQKITTIAKEFDKLSTANQAFVAEVLGGKWQISRLSILLQDLNNEMGYYNRALDAATGSQKALKEQYDRELRTVLESSPKRWDIMTNAIRNTIAKAFIPLLPAIFSVVQALGNVAKWFDGLSESTKRWILFTLAAVAIVGPLLQVMTTLGSVIGPVIIAIKLLALAIYTKLIPAIQAAMVTILRSLGTLLGSWGAALGAAFWPVVAVIAAVVAIIVLILKTDLEDRIWDILKSIARGFAALPGVFVKVFNSLIRVVQKAVGIIRDGLSYLNPFQRHSPSLVDNVKAGVGVILDEYKRFNQIPAMIRGAISALDTFSQVAAPGMKSARQAELSDIKTKIGKNDPKAAQAAGGVIDNILQLEAQLPGLAQEIDVQSRVVANWTQELKKADAVLTAAQARLDQAEAGFKGISDQLEAAKDRLADLGNMPIKGMRELEDQIFANSMAQNRLNLELLEYERAGMSLDTIRDKYAKLNGEIEMLQGERSGLRLGGAGSDILSMWDDQIDALKQQKVGLKENESAIKNIQDELDRLDLEGRFLNLTKSINFDPLQRQIEQMVNGLEEMSFDDIVAGIREQQALIATLQPQYDAMAEAVEREKVAVDAAKVARDAVAASLDAEQTKLNDLEDAYRSIESLIRDMESAMSDYADAAERAKAAKSDVDLFTTGIDSNYDIAGGDSVIGPEGTLVDIEQFNKDLEAELQAAIEDMGTFDIFAGIREQWNGIVSWIKDHKWELAGALAIAIGFAFGMVPGLVVAAILAVGYALVRFGPIIWGWVNTNIVQPIWRGIKAVADVLRGIWDAYIWPVLSWIIENIGGPLVSTLQVAWDIITTGFSIVAAAISAWWGIVGPVVLQFAEIVVGAFATVGKFIEDVVIPFFGVLGDFIARIFNEIIVPTVQFFWEIFQVIFGSIWEIVSKFAIPVFQMFMGVVEIVFVTIGRAISLAWTLMSTIFQGIWNFISDKLGPIFTWLGDEVIGPVWEGITLGIDFAWKTISGIFNSIKSGIENVLAPAFNWLLDNIIKPVFKAMIFTVGWAWDKIATLIEGGVNFLGDAFNLIAGVINKIADFLSIDVNISTVGDVSLPRLPYDVDIPGGGGIGKGGGGNGGAAKFMASGGIVPLDGGMFNQARAIIGEGSKVWPEFVIPTDPRYRGRAHSLLGDLHNRIGGSMVPTYAKGGVLDPSKRNEVGGWGPLGWAYNQGKNLATSAASWVGDKALEAMWAPVKGAASGIVNQIDMKFIKDIGHGLIGTIDDWVKGGDKGMDAKLKMGLPMPKKGAGSWQVIPDLLDKLKVPYKILSTFRPGATTRFSGNPSWHAQDRAIDLAGPTWLNHPQMLKIADAIYGAYKPQLHELIYGGPGAHNVFGGRDHQYQQKYLNEHVNHVHASLARGGFVVPRVPGGGLFRIGEGLHDEKVQVVPLHGGSGDGDGNVYNFYGDLSFPEIRNGDDAESFISNLEALARPR